MLIFVKDTVPNYAQFAHRVYCTHEKGILRLWDSIHLCAEVSQLDIRPFSKSSNKNNIRSRKTAIHSCPAGFL